MAAEKGRLFIIMICLPSSVRGYGKICPARAQRRRTKCRDVEAASSFTAFQSCRCNPVAQTVIAGVIVSGFIAAQSRNIAPALRVCRRMVSLSLPVLTGNIYSNTLAAVR
jgi:hypothetical protein